MEDGVKQGGGGTAGESLLTGPHLVENHSERKQVSARVQIFSQRLFRGHVGYRPHRCAGAGQKFFRSPRCRLRLTSHTFSHLLLQK